MTTVQQSNAINIHVFRNGDSHYKGRKFVVNHKQTRNFDSFLSMVTTGVNPPNGAVRKLYTPTHGHKVSDLTSLENNKFYVAAGAERFKRVQYFSIGRPDGQRQVHILRRSIKPVAHSRLRVSAKIRKPCDGPKSIHVYRNGDTLYPSIRLLLTSRMMADLDVVLQVITDKVNLINGAVRKLWHMDGSRVVELNELANEGSYVASGHERFKKVAYGINGPLEPSSPRLKRPSPPKQKPTLTRRPIKLSPKITPPRKPPSNPPQLKPEKKKKKEKTAEQKEAETVFHSKPAIVKRSREKDINNQLDFGEGEGGVFKAKEVRDETIGASEIQDTQETAVDLPIDQIAAEEVEDEEDPVQVQSSTKVAPADGPLADSFGEGEVKEETKEPAKLKRKAGQIEENTNNNNMLLNKTESLGEKSEPLEERNALSEKKNNTLGETTELREKEKNEDIVEELVEEREVHSPENVGEDAIDVENTKTAKEQDVNQRHNDGVTATGSSSQNEQVQDAGPRKTSSSRSQRWLTSSQNTNNTNTAKQETTLQRDKKDPTPTPPGEDPTPTPPAKIMTNSETFQREEETTKATTYDEKEVTGVVVGDGEEAGGENRNHEDRGEDRKETGQIEEDIEKYKELEIVKDSTILGEEDHSNLKEDKEATDVSRNDDAEAKLQREGEEAVIVEDVPILGEDSKDVEDGEQKLEDRDDVLTLGEEAANNNHVEETVKEKDDI